MNSMNSLKQKYKCGVGTNQNKGALRIVFVIFIKKTTLINKG